MKVRKVLSCVDCAVSILGDLPRCSACHARHTGVSAHGCERLAAWQILAVWLFMVLMIVGAMELLEFSGRLFQ